MKKFLIFIFSVLLSIPSYSQEFDEVDLLGTWYPDNEITYGFPQYMSLMEYDDMKGGFRILNYNSISYYWFDFQSITFTAGDPIDAANFIINGYVLYKEDQQYYQEGGFGLNLFFISNSNKLHIVDSNSLGTISVSLIIKELTSTRLVLDTYDGNFEFVFKKQTTDIKKNESEKAKPKVLGIFDINGNKRNTIGSGINIVKQTDNKTKKIIAK